jgi:hypothetical protein
MSSKLSPIICVIWCQNVINYLHFYCSVITWPSAAQGTSVRLHGIVKDLVCAASLVHVNWTMLYVRIHSQYHPAGRKHSNVAVGG